jgi:lipopolysaccharide/colanic/teichoic acid biosynthesis glycosyltransferase
MAILAVWIKIYSKGPVFYKSIRLGKVKQPFAMYKFRTLPVGSDKKIGPKLLSYQDLPLPDWVKILRHSRLDELPQLFNILKRDMDFIGPRPVRPEVYETHCQHIPNYDLRFTVRPGLIGYSQLFTPHSAPKRIRALLNNQMIKSDGNFLKEFYLIGLTIFLALKYLCYYIMKYGKRYYILKFKKKIINKRKFDRIKLKDATVSFSLKDNLGEKLFVGHLIHIDELYFKMDIDKPDRDTDKAIEGKSYLMKISIHSRKGKIKTAKVWCEVFRSCQESVQDSKCMYVFRYKPFSEYNRYIIDQYFLKKSIYSR